MQLLLASFDDGAEAWSVFEPDDRVMISAGARGFEICRCLVVIDDMSFDVLK